VEFKKENHHDGPLVDRFIELFDQRRDSQQPLLFTLWTATTHPPYDVPKDAGVLPADTNEARYLQAMRYADGHLARLIRHLKESPRWDRTLIFVLGDHSQPTPWQWTHTDRVGELNPGHTWTAFAILGGEAVAPAPGRDERVTSHVDLGPTILSAIDLRARNHFFGRNLLGPGDERPVWAFRYGSISREVGDQRTVFRVDEPSAHAYRFDRNDLFSYGGLEGGSWTDLPTDEKSLDRHRDVARAWALLLDEDRVAPPVVE
jgi:arylsulfatase A-like enzyme